MKKLYVNFPKLAAFLQDGARESNHIPIRRTACSKRGPEILGKMIFKGTY